MIKPKVLFLCTGNSCRTVMAEALLRKLADDSFEVISAGAEATPVDPDAVEAMREVGIDISDYQPKSVDAYLGQRFNFVISLCDRQQERTCPIFPGALWRLQWDVDNPALAVSPEHHSQVVRHVRDQIRERMVEFVSRNS